LPLSNFLPTTQTCRTLTPCESLNGTLSQTDDTSRSCLLLLVARVNKAIDDRRYRGINCSPKMKHWYLGE
jgi:hypothetical protein